MRNVSRKWKVLYLKADMYDLERHRSSRQQSIKSTTSISVTSNLHSFLYLYPRMMSYHCIHNMISYSKGQNQPIGPKATEKHLWRHCFKVPVMSLLLWNNAVRSANVGPEATEEHLCPWRHCFIAIEVLEILQKVQNCTTWNVIITWLDTKHKSGRTLHNSDVKSAFTFIFVSPYREEITTPPLLWYNDIRNTNVPQSPRPLSGLTP